MKIFCAKVKGSTLRSRLSQHCILPCPAGLFWKTGAAVSSNMQIHRACAAWRLFELSTRQCFSSMSMRPLSSQTDIDAVNDELQEFFGVSPPSDQEQQPRASASATPSQIPINHTTSFTHRDAAGSSLSSATAQCSNVTPAAAQEVTHPPAAPSTCHSGLASSASRHRSPSAPGLTHVDASGRASMVDTGGKVPTERVARASARVQLGGWRPRGGGAPS